MSNNQVRVGIIGLGHWGPNIVRNLCAHPRVSVVHVCDILESAFSHIERFISKDCKRTLVASEVINNPEVDLVAIITPAATHYGLVKKALLSNKHVFCEKPLCLDIKESEELCELAESKNRKLVVGFNFLFNNAVRKVKELVDSGRLGEIYYLTATRTHMGLIRKDVSVLWDLAPHDICMMNYFLDATPYKVATIGGSPLKQKNPDVAFLTLFYPNNILGQIHVSWVDSNKERILRIIGEKSRAVFNDLNDLEPVRLFEKGIGLGDRIEPDFGDFRFLLRDGDILSPKIHAQEPLKQMVDSLVKVVLDGEKNVSDGRFALNVTRVLVAAHQSLNLGGIPQNL